MVGGYDNIKSRYLKSVEKYCPDLYCEDDTGQIREAILDVVIHYPGGPFQRLVDFTIRCPHAASHTSCEVIVGAAASSGIADKMRRYGPSVICLAYETYGRLHADSVAHLRTLSMDMVKQHSRAGPGVVYHRLRLSLERALLFEVADYVLMALDGASHAGCRFAARLGSGR